MYYVITNGEHEIDCIVRSVQPHSSEIIQDRFNQALERWDVIEDAASNDAAWPIIPTEQQQAYQCGGAAVLMCAMFPELGLAVIDNAEVATLEMP
jgi:hypothetical protein